MQVPAMLSRRLQVPQLSVALLALPRWWCESQHGHALDITAGIPKLTRGASGIRKRACEAQAP